MLRSSEHPANNISVGWKVSERNWGQLIRIVFKHSPVNTWKIWIRRSEPDDASKEPSGENLTHVTFPLCAWYFWMGNLSWEDIMYTQPLESPAET